MSEPLLCKDCKHFSIPWRLRIASWLGRRELQIYDYNCKRKRFIIHTDLILGAREQKFDLPLTCRESREGRGDTYCGESGKFWTPRRKRDLFKLLTR